MLLRIIIWALIIYLAYRLISALVFGPPREAGQAKVKGKPKKPPLDLSSMDVEDAKFEEIKDKTDGRK